MQILLVVVYYFPRQESAAKLMHDLAIELKNRGHEVFVATPDDTLNRKSQICVEEGITVLRVSCGKIKNVNKVFRLVNEARLSSELWRKGKRFFKKNSCDLIIFYSPTIFFGKLIMRLKKLWKCPVYLILRDIFPQWALDAGVIKRNIVYWYLKRMEVFQYNMADIIGVEAPGALSYFINRGWTKRFRLEVLYNWTTIQEKDIPYRNYRKRLGLKGKVVFFYGGNIGVAQDIDNIVRLAENMRHQKHVQFLIVGDGSEVKHLKNLIKEKKIKNIMFLGSVSQKEYLSLLQEFDVGLITLNRKLKSNNYPGKMLGYMYFSLPILASINLRNDIEKLINKTESGFVCINGDDEKFFECAKLLANKPELRKRMGQNAHSLLENVFSVSLAVDQILLHYNYL